MTQVKWSKREKEYLMSLAQDGKMSVEEVVDMLNERFDNKRTKAAISIQKHQILKAEGRTRINRPKEEKEKIKMTINEKQKVKGYTRSKPKVGRTIGGQRNSRRGWTTADEQMLVGQWTAGTKQQKQVAEKLGRSRKACQTHLSKLRRHNPELHMALINRGATVNVLPATAEQYTLLDRIYVGLKHRKQLKSEKKIAKAERKAAKRNAKLEAKIAKLRGQL